MDARSLEVNKSRKAEHKLEKWNKDNKVGRTQMRTIVFIAFEHAHVLSRLFVSSCFFHFAFSISSRCSFVSHRLSRFDVCFMCSNVSSSSSWPVFSTLLLPLVVVAKLGSSIANLHGSHHCILWCWCSCACPFEGIPHNPSAPEKSAGPGPHEGTSWADEMEPEPYFWRVKAGSCMCAIWCPIPRLLIIWSQSVTCSFFLEVWRFESQWKKRRRFCFVGELHAYAFAFTFRFCNFEADP